MKEDIENQWRGVHPGFLRKFQSLVRPLGLAVVAIVCAFSLPVHAQVGQTYTVSIQGKVIAGNQPGTGYVQLRDIGVLIDDRLAESAIAADGTFSLSGSVTQVGRPNVGFRILTKVGTGINPCYRRISFNVDSQYVGTSSQPAPTLDVGTIELQGVNYGADETYDCVFSPGG